MIWSWWHLILLLPLAMIIILIAASGWRPSRPSLSLSFSLKRLMEGAFRVAWFMLLCTVIMLTFAMYQCIKAKATTPRSERRPTVINVGGLKPTMYHFGNFPDGVIRFTVRLGEVKFYPKGGRVRIIPPSPTPAWIDTPGVDIPRQPFPPGFYRVERVDPGATGIEVWN